MKSCKKFMPCGRIYSFLNENMVYHLNSSLRLIKMVRNRLILLGF